MQETLFGIDLGGTKIECVALNAAGKVLSRKRLPTEKEKGYDHIIRQINATLQLVTTETGITPTRLGIGTPGAMDPPTGLMKNSNTTCLNERPFRRDLERALSIDVRMANDANCFAIAESLLGAAKPYTQEEHLVFGIIMGTGVGGGLVINGKLWNGRQGIGGEWGHSFLDSSGGSCYCGQVGCVEQVIAGPALERYYESISGQRKPLVEIVAAYESGQAGIHEKATVERLIHFFGRGLANLIDILDPTAIVVGGGVSNIRLLYSEGVERVQQYVFNTRLDTPILAPALGDSAGVFGAAMLAKD